MSTHFDLADRFAEAFKPAIDEPELDHYGLIALKEPMTFLNLWHGPKALMPNGASIGEPLLYQSYVVVGSVDDDGEQLPDIEYVTSARVIAPCGADGTRHFGDGVKCTRARGHDGGHRSTIDHRLVQWTDGSPIERERAQ